MNRYKVLLMSMFLFLISIILPIKVNALSYESDLVDLKRDNFFKTNKFELNLEYIENSNEPSIIIGSAKRSTSNIYYYHYIFYYYNEEKEEIGASDGYSTIFNTIANENGSFMSNPLLSKNINEPYKLSDVRFYRLFIEPSTKEMVDNYKNNQKINMDGIDPITDFNKVDMKKPTIINKEINTQGNGEYALTKYKIDIQVNENNTFNINEDITAYFNINKHGIFRKIPLKNTVIRLDGTKSTNHAKISEIKVNEQFTKSNEFGYRVIKIGNPDLTLTGSKYYTISYLYNIGKDPSKGYDEFYFNLIGNEWDTTISDIEFTITMPKEFDETKLGFSSGLEGSTDNRNIEYSVDGKVITGRFNGVLGAGEALTVRLELEEGYFVGAEFKYSPLITLFLVLPIIGALISIVLWYKYGRDEMVIQTVEFYPPKGLNSAEVGFLYKGYTNNKDVLSLLIYLADKGYLKIEELKRKSPFTKKQGFRITKLKEYDGDNVYESMFFDGLFESAGNSLAKYAKSLKIEENEFVKELREAIKEDDAVKELESKQEKTDYTKKLKSVTDLNLYNNFYLTLNNIIEDMNKKQKYHKIFEKVTESKSIIIILMILLSVFSIILIPVYEYSGIESLSSMLILIIIYILFYSVSFSKQFTLLSRLIWCGFLFIHSLAMFSTLPLFDALLSDKMLLIGFLVGLVSIVIMIICLKLMPKRTPYGNEMLGKIKGFKTFLESAEKQKLEQLVNKDPAYFYNILPFTYVLGVSDKWIKKFETISLQEPDWYVGSTAFNTSTFGSFMDSTMASASRSMSSSSSSSSSSSGGSSGGGSSGGGSGGGGGGSW